MDGLNQEELEPPTLPELPLKLAKVIPETKELYNIFQCSICYEVSFSTWNVIGQVF